MSAGSRLSAAVVAAVTLSLVVLGVAAVLLAGGERTAAALAVVVVGSLAVGVTAHLGVSGHLDRRLARSDERGRAAFRRAVENLGDVLESGRDRPRIVAVLLDAALLLVSARCAAFWRAAGRGLVAGASTPTGVVTDGARLASGSGLAGRSAGSGSVLVSRPDDDTAMPAPPEPGCSSAVAVPVTVEGSLYGVLAVYDRAEGGAFSGEEVDTLVAFARQAQSAITTTFLHEEAERLAITDGLTGVWNRRWFELEAAREVDRATRFGEPFSLVLLDIDDFKALNDTHGHQAGDAALVELARRIMSSTREVDAVARYGGEEFTVLLPRTDVGEAAVVAQRVLDAITASPFPVSARTHVPVTVSMGLAAHPAHGATVAELVAAADGALYRAKASGKNRIELAGAAPAPDTEPGGPPT